LSSERYSYWGIDITLKVMPAGVGVSVGVRVGVSVGMPLLGQKISYSGEI
jgi:hypothetical protein